MDHQPPTLPALLRALRASVVHLSLWTARLLPGLPFSVFSLLAPRFSLLLLCLLPSCLHAEPSQEPKGPFHSMFWIWQDEQIENPQKLQAELDDLKKAGFDGLFVMPRATRYQLCDRELIDAVKLASKACAERHIEFIWGPDPRFAAAQAVRETGFGAEVLLTTAEPGKRPKDVTDIPQINNEGRIIDGRYSLRYVYPTRRDSHMLTEAGLWFNPLKVDAVVAYQWKDGKVDPATLRDLTASHHFFVNRSQYYVEVFGKVDLPPGDWRVIAFPRFMTNMYAFESPAHEAVLNKLIDTYHAENIHFDGFWWDEPGYYLVFGQFPISDTLYANFKARFGYDLKPLLHSLLLPLADNSHLKVRHDYFTLVMDGVFGAEKRFWQRGEKLFGHPLRMGIHQNWHSIPDNLYHGSADLWRGLEAVDAGYTDDSGFERYFRCGLGEKYEQVSYLVLANTLARYSRSGKSFYNRWGVNYGPEVPAYFNDLMAAFSSQWLQHAYGYTGVLGASRNFGPGFPNHPTWPLLPAYMAKASKVYQTTHYTLPVADVAVLCPMATILTSREPENSLQLDAVNRLVGAMPAAGVQADFLSDAWLEECTVSEGGLLFRGHRYKALVVPCAQVLSSKAAAVLTQATQAGLRIHYVNTVPARTLEGATLSLPGTPAFDIGKPEQADQLIAKIASLQLPSPVTALPGAYLTVLPGQDGDLHLIVMPITPGSEVSGQVKLAGVPVQITATSKLALYTLRMGKSHATTLE